MRNILAISLSFSRSIFLSILIYMFLFLALSFLYVKRLLYLHSALSFLFNYLLSLFRSFFRSPPLRSCAGRCRANEYAKSATHASLLRALGLRDLLASWFPPRDRDMFLPFRRVGAV